jgi:hypothetical protein
MALPLADRVLLAQALWQSINSGLVDVDERDSVREAVRRDNELTAGTATGRAHDEVIQSARRAIRCG